MMVQRILSGSLLLVLGLAAAGATSGLRADDLTQLKYTDGQPALRALDREIAQASRDLPRLREIANRLVRQLDDASATPAARQAICQRLGNVLALGGADGPGADVLARFEPMLTREPDVENARLALERVPGAAVDRVFLAALPKSTGRVRLALLQVVATRRLVAALPTVETWIADSDQATARSAIHTLGALGTPEALAALDRAPQPTSPEVVAATLAITPHLSTATANPALDRLQRNEQVAPSLRAAALRQWLERNPDAAAAKITEVLSGGDWPHQETAIEFIAGSTAPGLVPALTAKLATWGAPTQAAVIAALGHKGEGAAAVAAALASDAPEVRAAAATALGFLPGTPEIADKLAALAAGDSPEAPLARRSLARLKGPGIDLRVLDGARHETGALQAVFIEQLAARNISDALPLLREFRTSPDVAVRSAALRALAELAPATEQEALIHWATGASDPTELMQALRAIIAVTQRNPDTTARAEPVIHAIETAPADVAVRLVPVLARLGDRSSADAAARLALGAKPELASAATAALARSTDAAALPALVTVAEKTGVDGDRRLALQGAVRALERPSDPWTADTTALAIRVYGLALDEPTRSRIVRSFARARDEKALAFVEGLAAETGVRDDADVAARAIRKSRTKGSLAKKAAAGAKADAGWIPLFDGRDLSGWRSNDETPGVFSVENGAIKVSGGRAHLFYVGADGRAEFKNFEFKAKVMTTPGANSGIYFHTHFVPNGWPPDGYECQVNTSHADQRKTGSLYAVKDVMVTSPSRDNEWFDYVIKVDGPHIVIQIDGKTVVDWTQPADWDPAKALKDMPGRKLGTGTFALQGHDPKSTTYYRDISVRPLP